MNHIETCSKRSVSTFWKHEADFILDLTTFKVLKHRYGRDSVSPEEAYKWLTYYLEQPATMRILLLTD